MTDSNANQAITRSILWIVLSLLFVGMALAHSLRLDDDSYAHFAVSVETVRSFDIHKLVTDTWNKPWTGVVYGTTGLMGIHVARMASVGFCLLSAFLLGRIAERHFRLSPFAADISAAVLFLFTPALLPQVFLTMTEQLAAFLLVLGLWLHLNRQNTWLAMLSWGLMPLARIESVTVVAGLGIAVVFNEWLRSRSISTVRAVGLGCVAVIPFVCWWAAGAILEGDVGWLAAGYVYPRGFKFVELLCVNALTGLPAALSIPQICFLLLGFIALAAKGSESRNGLLAVCLFPILIYAAFISVMVVYPKGSGYGELAVAALNTRSYNMIMPLMCLAGIAGMSGLALNGETPGGPARPRRSLLAFVCIFALVVLAGYYFFLGCFPVLFGGAYRVMVVGVMLLVGAGFALVLSVPVFRRSGSQHLLWLAGYTALTVPLLVPFFWHPFRWHDHRESAQIRLIETIRTRYDAGARPPMVLQTMNGRLDFMGGIREPKIGWAYYSLVDDQLDSMPANSWIVVEIDENGRALGSYDPSLDIMLADALDYRRLQVYTNTSWIPLCDRVIARFSSRNRAGGWILYEKIR